jgi:hypothetical protein
MILNTLAKQVGWAVVANISNELIANLVGVLPHAVEMARSLVHLPVTSSVASAVTTHQHRAVLALSR